MSIQVMRTRLLDAEIAHLHELKEEALAASLRVAQKEAEVVALMDENGTKTYKATMISGNGFRATLVRGERVKYNELGLKKALGAAVWRKVTKTSLDTKKLDEAVQEGLVPVMVVAQHSEVLFNKAYVKITPVALTDD